MMGIMNWNKTAPGPHLTNEIIRKTSEKYIAAYEMLTGKRFIWRG
jgi:phosphoribosylaminoimidazole-succinocarboxamide synthase